MRLELMLTCAALALTTACGGDDDDGGGGGGGTGSTTGSVDSGVDDSKPLSSLTNQELAQIAQSQAAAVDVQAFGEFTCKFAATLGLAIAGDMAPTQEQIDSCNMSYQQCRDQLANQQVQVDLSMVETVAVPADNATLADCNVTVGQYEQCLTDALAIAFQVFDGLSCESPTITVDTTTASPASCAELENTCNFGQTL